MKKKTLTTRQLVEACGGVEAVRSFCRFSHVSAVRNWFLANREIPYTVRLLLEYRASEINAATK